MFIETQSGASRDRPVLAEALAFMRPGDTLLTWRMDRLARSVRQLTSTVEALEARGIQYRSLTENIDTSSPGGRLVFHVFASVAQFERELVVERVKAGLEAARKRGRVGGRKPAMTDAKVKAARAMLEANELPVAEIARQLGVGLTSFYRAFPAARAGANAGGVWDQPKLRRTPRTLAPQALDG